jgi:hypothetical protein
LSGHCVHAEGVERPLALRKPGWHCTAHASKRGFVFRRIRTGEHGQQRRAETFEVCSMRAGRKAGKASTRARGRAGGNHRAKKEEHCRVGTEGARQTRWQGC